MGRVPSSAVAAAAADHVFLVDHRADQLAAGVRCDQRDDPGGPEGTGTTTMVYQVYVETFRNFRAGYGATVATIMFLVLLAVTYYQVRVMDRGSGSDAGSAP